MARTLAKLTKEQHSRLRAGQMTLPELNKIIQNYSAKPDGATPPKCRAPMQGPHKVAGDN